MEPVAGALMGGSTPAVATDTRWWSAARTIAADIKLSHSVFALPFALLAACLAGTDASGSPRPRFFAALGLIVAAMVLARTAAMLANRLLDRRIDAENQRTAGRAIPSGRLSARAALMVLLACAGGFFAVCAGFGVLLDNWWPARLSVPVLAWLCAYGLLKRWTSLCHVYLGASLAISPVAAGLAIEPASVQAPVLWLLSGMVLCWVAGFDVIYALQDVEADRRQGLYSMPSRWGERRAIWVSRLLHVVAWGLLMAAARADIRFGWLMAGASGVVGVLLLVEHLTLARWGKSRIALTVFTLNGVISCVVGAAGIMDIALFP